MRSTPSWYQTLAWKLFLRQAATILALVSALLLAVYLLAGRSARASALAGLTASSRVLERTLAQEGRVMDAGLEVFTQYSGNVALVEEALETGRARSLQDALSDNLPRLGASLAIVARPDGTLLASTDPGAPRDFPEAGILQMALDPEAARAAGQPGPFYRGFLQVGWGARPGVYHAVARPLTSPGGAPLGAILVGRPVDAAAALDLRREAIPAPPGDGPPAHLALLSRFRTVGATLAAPGPLDGLLARNPGFLAARAGILEARRSPVVPVALGGKAYLAMLSPIHGVNALDLEMASLLLLPTDPLLAPFRSLSRAILGVGVAGILLALWLGLRSARTVTAPLQALARAAGTLADGGIPEDLPPVPSTDEVGVLDRAFRAMLAELKAKDELLALLDAAGRTSQEPSPDTVTTWPVKAPARDGALPAGLGVGEVFASRYRVEGVLGSGGMGVVLRVRDLTLEEDVALKVIRPELASVPAFLDHLKQEIRLARRISHRFVLRAHDFGEWGGVPYVTMEYLKGVTLQSLLDARGRIPLPLALRIARQVAEGLEAAHAAQVLHCDIKPANVLFDGRGDVKIMDFGLAAPAWGAFREDRVAGTPRYMAPEQILGERVDPRCDLYALGVMAFELAAGVPPYPGSGGAEVMRMHLEAPVPSLRAACPEAPWELDALVARLMAKRREDRPESAAEVLEALRRIGAPDGP